MASTELVVRTWARRQVKSLSQNTLPLFRTRRSRLAFCDVGPLLRVLGIDLKPIIQIRLGIRFDRRYWTFRLAHPPIDAFVWMDHEHVFVFVDQSTGHTSTQSVYLHSIQLSVTTKVI